MEREPSFLILGVAALAVALWVYTQNSQLETQLTNCQSEYKGFKEGTIYNRR